MWSSDSLRGAILKDWEALGLSFVPNVGENSVHASASPFEGLAERMNWLQADPATVKISGKISFPYYVSNNSAHLEYLIALVVSG